MSALTAIRWDLTWRSRTALKMRGYDCVVVSTDPIPDVYAPFYKPDDVFIGDVPPGPAPTHIACLDISDPERTGGFFTRPTKRCCEERAG